MKLTHIERRYLLHANESCINLSAEKYAKSARPTFLKLVEKGLLRRAELEDDDDAEIYEITEEGEKAITQG